MSPRPSVLVVEDDGDLRRLLAEALTDAGLDVATAADGLQALARIDEHRPDLLLLDMKMPVMDGPELCRVLDERGDRPPVVVLTAAHDPRASAAAVHAEAFLGKPFDLDELAALVLEVLERSRAGPATR